MKYRGIRAAAALIVLAAMVHGCSEGRVDVAGGEEQGFPAVLEAAAEGNWFIVDAAIRGEMNPNWQDSNGRTLLHHAAAGGQAHIITYLFGEFPQLEIDPNIRDNEGRTPLDYATSNGHEQAAQALRQNGATE